MTVTTPPPSSLPTDIARLVAALEKIEHFATYLCSHLPESPDENNTIIEARHALASAEEMVRRLQCGHHSSLLIKSVESDYQVCELCEALHRKRDAETMEAHLIAENTALKAQLARFTGEPSGEVVEAVARGICEADGIEPDAYTRRDSDNNEIPCWREYIPHARAAISAYRAAMEGECGERGKEGV